MPRYATVADHLSESELKRRYQKATDPVEGRRYHLMWLVKRGRSLKQAAEVVGINYDYAKDVLKAYNTNGPGALSNGRKRPYRRGRPTLLSDAQLQQLQLALQHPHADGGDWTGPKVAKWIEQVTGHQVWPQRGWDYLKRCGYTCQSSHPRPMPTGAKWRKGRRRQP